jgi:hypothetical protein
MFSRDRQPKIAAKAATTGLRPAGLAADNRQPATDNQ